MTMVEFPYRLRRCGVIMEPEPGNDLEVEGVLNPGSAWLDGELYLLPRLVAEGNVSRVGLARVVVTARKRRARFAHRRRATSPTRCDRRAHRAQRHRRNRSHH